ncbi:MAG: DUF1499 domain-containing protein [Planctomycetota bacterium]|nr:DUF1499 domain-containing protein [Planctomycetota bacterium]
MNLVSYLGATIAVFGLVSVGASGPGFRLGWWSFKTGLAMVKAAAMISLAAIAVCLVGLAISFWELSLMGRTVSIVGLVVASAVLSVTLIWKRNLDSVPYIHDISTDTETPPLFEAILPLRRGAENASEYGGLELARQQHLGYPDLKPGALKGPPAAAFPRALQAAREMGWEIVDSNPTTQRIEATDTTFWFGFKDDVVVRLTPSPTGTRVDVRSVSRVGKSDVGTNARRINAFIAKLET